MAALCRCNALGFPKMQLEAPTPKAQQGKPRREPLVLGVLKMRICTCAYLCLSISRRFLTFSVMASVASLLLVIAVTPLGQTGSDGCRPFHSIVKRNIWYRCSSYLPRNCPLWWDLRHVDARCVAKTSKRPRGWTSAAATAVKWLSWRPHFQRRLLQTRVAVFPSWLHRAWPIGQSANHMKNDI